MNDHDGSIEDTLQELAKDVPEEEWQKVDSDGYGDYGKARDLLQRLEAERLDLLALCHATPQAVGMDTTHLKIAVQRLINFAWEAVQGSDPNARRATDKSLREFAAIHRGVPNSGLPWLDAMIDESRRLDLAGQAWTAINPGCRTMEMVAARAFEMADAMLAEWRKRNADPGTTNPVA